MRPDAMASRPMRDQVGTRAPVGGIAGRATFPRPRGRRFQTPATGSHVRASHAESKRVGDVTPDDPALARRARDPELRTAFVRDADVARRIPVPFLRRRADKARRRGG